MKLESLIGRLGHQDGTRAASIFKAADEAADALWDHLLEPADEDEERKTVVITPNTDADAFGSEVVFHALQEIVESITGGYNRPFAYERPMRLFEGSEHEHSYARIASRHGAEERVRYLIADAGGADLDLVTEHFRHGVVLDHHPPKGALGRGFLSVNPLEHGLTDNDLSGASLTYLVLDSFVERLLAEKERLGLPKEMVREIKRHRQNALLVALAGSSADRVGQEGLNEVLYEQAKESQLLERIEFGAFGLTTKPLYKIVAEASIPVNLEFPIMTLSRLERGLSHALKADGLTPRKREIVQELFESYGRGYKGDGEPGRAIFAVEYRWDGDGTTHIGQRLFLNRMNLQALSDEEIAEVNGLCKRLGFTEDVLAKETFEDRLGAYDIVVPAGAIAPSRFITFADDLHWTVERYVAAKHNLQRELRAVFHDLGGEETGLRCPSLLDNEGNIASQEMSTFTTDEVSVVREWWERNIHAYGDPLKREAMIALLNRPSYMISMRKSTDELLSGFTVEELGNLMTAISKIGLRDPFIEALHGRGAEAETAAGKVREAHHLYKRIVWNGLRETEERLRDDDTFARKVKDRIYVLDYSFLEDMVSGIVDDHLARGSLLTPGDIGRIDLRTMVGVFTGVVANTRKFREDYVMLFSYVPDPDARDGIKISGRYSELGADIFGRTDLGEVMLIHGGGGHPQAAATRMRRANLSAFLGYVSGIDVEQTPYEELERKMQSFAAQVGNP